MLLNLYLNSVAFFSLLISQTDIFDGLINI